MFTQTQCGHSDSDGATLITDMDGDMADTGEAIGAILAMLGDTRATGDLDGVTLVTGEEVITETMLTATEEEGLQLTTAEETMLTITEAMRAEITLQTETTTTLTEVLATDLQTAILITEEAL